MNQFPKSLKSGSEVIKNDEYWMRYAISLANRASTLGEVPVGAVIVTNDEIVAEGWNQPISTSDPTAHAEIVALRAAANKENNYRLSAGMTLYVTLEPCPMCAGAMVHARITRLVYGARDPRTGAASSVFNLLDSAQLNHRVEMTGGVLEAESGELLRGFFKERR
jgi:tRNA(adenine34) deaminase